MTQELEDYILAHIDAEPEHLHELDRDTHIELLYSRMCSGHLQGRLLKMLVRMIRPKLVLELGTYSGYSAQCLAEGLLDDDAHLHTIEIEDELEDFLRAHFAKSPVGDRITLHIGDCNEILPRINKQFDLVFIDANKRQYVDYFNLVIDHVKPSGFIIADNRPTRGDRHPPPARRAHNSLQETVKLAFFLLCIFLIISDKLPKTSHYETRKINMQHAQTNQA